MVMPPRPRAPFEMIEHEFVLAFAIVLFTAPTPLRQADQTAKPERFIRDLRQSVLDRRGRVVRPFDEQMHRRRPQVSMIA